MKPANTDTINSKAGMTLLELTVVILVLLSLISILFIGASAWKAGSDRAGCIMNIRNVQQGMRSFSNVNGYTPGCTIASTGNGNYTGWLENVIGNGLFVQRTPVCPSGTGLYAYAPNSTIPVVGTLAMTCSLAGGTTLHVPATYTDW